MMSNAMNVAILVFDDVEVLDFAGPFEVFNVASEAAPRNPDPPFNVFTIGHTGGIVRARGGLKIEPNYSLANTPQPDILIVPGGYGTRRLLKNDVLLKWLHDQGGKVQHMLSVCTGSLVLAQAGLLRDMPATSHHTEVMRLSELSPGTQPVTDERFVVHGNVITSGGISAGIDMSFYVVEKLLGAEVLALVKDEMEWLWFQK
jgi:transcriptional regulator GlxA family with amidase domain